ncbi:MAG: hypothetical protein FJ266_07370 [Planctomycetes bacterium]|nr:hypothetical protein [Planctomycetota bacterium]
MHICGNLCPGKRLSNQLLDEGTVPFPGKMKLRWMETRISYGMDVNTLQERRDPCVFRGCITGNPLRVYTLSTQPGNGAATSVSALTRREMMCSFSRSSVRLQKKLTRYITLLKEW